jgi:AI-2 transport protein TqsA
MLAGLALTATPDILQRIVSMAQPRPRFRAPMRDDTTTRVMLGLCATVLAAATLHLARSVLAPVAFSLLAIALVWPLQNLLARRLPKLVASVLVMLATLLVLVTLASAVAWGFSMIAEWLIQNAERFQNLHLAATTWLQTHGVSVSGILATRFDVGWIIRLVQDIAGRMSSFAGFFLLFVILTLIGLLEVDECKYRLQTLEDSAKGQALLQIAQAIAVKFRKYMLVRSLASVLTGVLIFAFTLFAGLELATAWGIMAFTLNFIPFIGPFIATVLPTLFAVVQFEAWQMAALIFLGSTLIQFLIGNYLEPRLFGSILNISPYLAVFAVFFWALLWGLPGAFIGVPLTIALLTCCEAYPSSRWLARLLSGRSRA